MSTNSATWTEHRGRPPVAAVPTQLGRYELARMFSRGGCATVFASYEPMLDRPIALDVFGQRRRRGGS